MKDVRIEISVKTILVALASLVAVWLLYQIREIVVMLFIAFIFTSALNPFVDFLEKRKIPRIVAVVFIYVVALLLLSLLVLVTIPSFISQVRDFFNMLPSYVDKALILEKKVISTAARHNIVFAAQDIVNFFAQQLGQVPSLFNVTFGLLSGIMAAFTTAVFTFYLLLEHRSLKEGLVKFFPIQHQEHALVLILRLEKKMGEWVRGQLALCIIIGLLTWVGLEILGVEFAPSLAVINGVLEIVPIIGPVIGLFPATLIALDSSPILALLTISWLILIQQLENHLIVPNVMKTAVGINPLLVILALLIGAKLMGVGGALLSVPIAAMLQVIGSDMVHNWQHKN